MQLCICTCVICDGSVALEIHWVIVCTSIRLVSFSPCCTLLIAKIIFTHRWKEESIKLKFKLRSNITNVANTLSDIWMWLNPRVNLAVTGDFSAISAWVTETRSEEQSALAFAPLFAVIVLHGKATCAPQSHDSEVDHLSTEKVATV